MDSTPGNDAEIIRLAPRELQIAGLAAEAFARFSLRQRQVTLLMAAGNSPKQISDQLHIAFRTVEFHRAAIYRALGVRTLGKFYAKCHGATVPDAQILTDLGFTSVEQQVIGLLFEGKTEKEIAGALDVCLRMVTKHKDIIFKKLCVDNLFDFRKELLERAKGVSDKERLSIPENSKG